MTYTRKPLPKTQYEISKNTTEPLYNRANEISTAGDSTGALTIGLKDLDYAIQYYFEQVIKPQVNRFGATIDVPVMYGAPEKWKNMQADGYIRDSVGKIQVPLIAYKRTAVTKNRTLGSKVDANYPAIYYTQQLAYSKENRYDQFSKLTNSKPIQTFINSVMCDYVDVTYDFVIWTDQVEQMNVLVEAILYSEGSFWGEKERFKFRTKIDSFTNTTDLLQDAERLVRTNFTVTLFGYIIPDTILKQLSDKLSEKTFSQRQLVVDTDLEDAPMVIGGATPAGISTTATGGSVTRSNVNALTIAYLNTNKTVVATTITIPSTAIFIANFLSAPNGLPTTSASSFSFFINGLYVEPSAITSFTNPTTNVCTLELNTAELGFTLQSDDEIVAIGKFI